MMRIPSLANLSYPERLAVLNLEPLELRRLKSDLVLYYKCLHDLEALPNSILQCQISLHKCELYALPNLMKTTSLNAVYFVGIVNYDTFHFQFQTSFI